MNATQNPFAPGAGSQPPELVGRDQIIEDSTVALQRIKQGRSDRGHLLLGLRGVGKTVLLNRIDSIARTNGYLTMVIEAPEGGRLAEILVPRLRTLLIKLSRRERAKALATKGLGVLRAFASAFKVSIGAVELGIVAEEGVADSGNLEIDLPEMLIAVAEAAQVDDGGVAILIDEVQYLSGHELGALIVAMHRSSQKNLPIVLFGAGLPQISGLAGEAKSYAERLFRYPTVGPLSGPDAMEAIRKPLENEGVAIEPGALDRIATETQGYPYFLQEWGYHAWDVAKTSPITMADVENARIGVLAQLDSDFFKVRFDRLTTREKDYMRAMADLGPGPHRSGAVARQLGITVGQAGPLRNALIKKGMIYSGEYGKTSFTVPMFDAFMRRSMPGWSPRVNRKGKVAGHTKPRRKSS